MASSDTPSQSSIAIKRLISPLMYWPDSVYTEDDQEYTVLFTNGRYDVLHSRETLIALIAALQRTVDNLTDADFIEFNEARKREREQEWQEEQQRRKQALPKTKPPQNGFVYVLRAGDQYKIGCTKNPAIRKRMLALEIPFDVEILYLIPSADMYATEAEIHTRFHAQRTKGEWFILEQDAIALLVTEYNAQPFQGAPQS